jgi:hypothetical protein
MLLAAGLIPYADFSIWGPHQLRMVKKLTFMAMVISPDGNWKRTELRGPPGYDVWWASWRVLRTALVLFEEVTPEVLDNYAELIRKHAKSYNDDIWFILYQADVRMRQEQFERILRRLERGRVAGIPCKFNYDPTKPWEACFKAAVADTEFWDQELKHPANLYLLKAKTAGDLMNDGTAHPEIQAAGLTRAREQGGRGTSRGRSRTRSQRRSGKHRGGGDRQSRRSRDHNNYDYTHTEAGCAICTKFNQGTCKEVKSKGKGKSKGNTAKAEGGNCPDGNAHVCLKCLGNHSSKRCTVKDY